MKLKRTIITLLAAATLAACGPKPQDLKLSNPTLCLRDEATGEWLIGLFDNYAIYDCDYWNYAEKSDTHAVLTNGDQRKEVRLESNTITIDGVKYKVSALTTKYLPDYPVKDETPFDGTWLDAEQVAIVRVVHRSGKADIGVNNYVAHLLTNDVINFSANSDSLGRYEARIPVIAQTGSMLNTDATQRIHKIDGWIWIPYVVAPGEKLLLYIDDVEGRIYAMGPTARMVNEFLNHPLYGHNVDYDELKKMNFTDFIKESGKKQKALAKKRESILTAHPTLSKRYRDFTDGMRLSFYAYDLWSLRYNNSKVRLRNEIIGEANRCGIFNIDIPYTVLPRFGQAQFLDKLCGIAIEKYCTVGSGVPFLQNILQKATDGRLKLSSDDIRLIESEMPAVAAIPVPSIEKLDSLGIGIKGFYLTDTLQSMFSSRPELTNEILLYCQQKEIEALDSLLHLPPTMREVAVASNMVARLNQQVKPLTDQELQVLRENVHQSYLLDYVQNASNRLIASREAADAVVMPDPRPLAELTDGEDIFRKIVEPYAGRYIYLDVWGTWCGPCRKMMEFVPQMKEQLADLDIVYLYLANNSPDESWQTAIAQYHLTGSNCVHYNLPKSQQAALERYIGVGSYPTYKLVLPNGNLLPATAPQPDRPADIRRLIEKTKK